MTEWCEAGLTQPTRPGWCEAGRGLTHPTLPGWQEPCYHPVTTAVYLGGWAMGFDLCECHRQTWRAKVVGGE